MPVMHRNRSVDVHSFAMVPRAEIPRSSFNIQTTHKSTFNASYLIPVYVDEVMPGDSFRVSMTAFCRMATPIYPVMDNLHLDSFFFFVPNRLVWSNWKKFMGEQANPADSISYTVPTVNSPAGGYAVGSLQDYLGLPTAGQISGANVVTHSALFTRAYNLIWNEWFRDENLQNSVVVDVDDGPDLATDYSLLRRNKRHDYFTSALPWPQKGGTSVSLPLGTSANVVTNSTGIVIKGITELTNRNMVVNNVDDTLTMSSFGGGAPEVVAFGNNTGLYADLSTATAATINQIRQAFQIQKLLERDARGGTRYTEIIQSHFGVKSPDSRLQRPEYLGGGSSPIVVNPVAQTSGTSASGTTTPMGTLAAIGTGLARGHGFAQSFTEHGMIIGLVSVRADLTYQQGLRKMFSRSTRYDFYFPAFAMLGEQSILNQEIYCTGNGPGTDTAVFGYQERWAELRYHPSRVSGLFRSTSSGTIDAWHMAQRFTALPTLNSTFISENVPMDRVLAVGANASGQQFLFDSFFEIKAVRPLPMYSVPGLIDHF